MAHDENSMKYVEEELQSIYYGQVKNCHRCFITKAFLKVFAILTGKYLCRSFFSIKNFIATLLKRDFNTAVFLWILQNFMKLKYELYLHNHVRIIVPSEFLKSRVLNNICKRLLLSVVILTRSIKSNLAFAQPILLKFLFQNENK